MSPRPTLLITSRADGRILGRAADWPAARQSLRDARAAGIAADVRQTPTKRNGS